MNCIVCREGETRPGLTTVPLHRGETLVIVKKVPAEICENCGEAYMSETVTEELLRLVNTTELDHTEIKISKFAA